MIISPVFLKMGGFGQRKLTALNSHDSNYIKRMIKQVFGHQCAAEDVFVLTLINKLYRRAAATICPRPSPPSMGAEAPRAVEPTAPADRNVTVVSHAQYVPTLTAAAA